ncbi:MAG: LysR family transcriptional regulator [Clostridia bacterium]|nr:LysR family transcriptional regulator [Clostridia bacterium]
MEMLQLIYFCDAAQTENFSKTAKKYLVPPSNISQSIKRLENELETPLFERQANKIKLNNSGLLFYKNAKSALELLENAKKALKNIDASETIKINIHINRRIAMGAIESFRKLHPNISFITSHSIDDFSNDFDIVITDKELDLPYLKQQATEERFLLAYNKNEFEFDGEITASKLENSPFITMSRGSSIYENTYKLCNRLGFSPNIVLQSEDPFYIRKCVELGIGIALVPELSWKGQFSKNIVLKNIGEIKRKVYLYKKYTMNEYIEKFSDMLREKFSL